MASTATSHAQAAPGTAKRPDVVLFIADDLRREDVGPYGGRDAATPAIDWLAREGTTFRNAFAASPTCTVSRSALLTGDYPIRNGAHTNHSPVSPGIVTWPAYLARAGYRVVVAGKTDFGPRDAFPFEYLAGSTVHPPGRPRVLESILGTDAIDRLLATSDRSKPIALIVADYASHVPWPDNRHFEPGRIALEPALLDTPELRASRARYLTKVEPVDHDLAAVRASLARWRPGDALFLFTADQGALFPSAKHNLYDQGIATPLIVSWKGHIAGGQSTSALVSLVDVLPTIQEAAGATAASGIDGRSFLSVLEGRSSAPVRSEVFAAHTGERGEGRNKAPMRAIRTLRWKLIENLRPDLEFVDPISANPATNPDTNYWHSWTDRIASDPNAALLVHRFRQRAPLELYDLDADQYELTNLASDPRYASVRQDLIGRLTAWRRQQGDPLDRALMPSDARSARFPYTTCPCNSGQGAVTSNEEPGASAPRRPDGED